MASRVKVILLERIPRLGELGEEVSVSAGHARNWLLRNHQALPATQASRAEFESRRKELEQKQQDRLEAAQKEAEKWQGLELSIEVQAGPGGKMYGSVSTRDLASQLREKGLEVENRQILLPYALRELGEHQFAVQLHHQVRVEVNLRLVVAGSNPAAAVASEDAPEESPAT